MIPAFAGMTIHSEMILNHRAEQIGDGRRREADRAVRYAIGNEQLVPDRERAAGVDHIGHIALAIAFGGREDRTGRPPEDFRRIILVEQRRAEAVFAHRADAVRSEEHTSELQSLMRISSAVFCLKKKNNNKKSTT